MSDNRIVPPAKAGEESVDSDGLAEWQLKIIQRHWDSLDDYLNCLLYTSPSPRDATLSRMPSSA